MNTTDEERQQTRQDEQVSTMFTPETTVPTDDEHEPEPLTAKDAVAITKQKRLQDKIQSDPSSVAGQAFFQLAMQETQKWLLLMKKNKDTGEPLFDKVSDLVRMMEMALKLMEMSKAEDIKNPYRVQQMPPEQYAKTVEQAWETWVFCWENRHPGQYMRRDVRELIRACHRAVLVDSALPADAMEYRNEQDAPPIEELRARYTAAQEDWEPWGARKGKEEE